MTVNISRKPDVVREIQRFLYELSQRWDWLPTVFPDGTYGPQTREAVTVFQRRFDLPQTGEVDYATWTMLYRKYRDTFLFRTRAANPSMAYAGLPLHIGSRGYAVNLLRNAISELSRFYPALAPLAPSSLYQYSTERAVRALQNIYRMEQNGIVNAELWNRIFSDVESKQTVEADRQARPGRQYPYVYSPGN